MAALRENHSFCFSRRHWPALWERKQSPEARAGWLGPQLIGMLMKEDWGLGSPACGRGGQSGGQQAVATSCGL